MKYQSLHFAMLPPDIQKMARELIPQATWRMPPLYSFLGQLEVQASKSRGLNDFSSWKKSIKLGEDISKWIQEDKNRFECWERICREKNNLNTDTWYRG